MLQGQDSGKVKQTLASGSDSDQATKNAGLFYAIRKKTNKISEDDRLEEIKKYLNEENINAVDKNNKNNTVLHIAVKKNYQKIVEFLLTKGAKIDIKNSEGKSPIDITQDQQDQNLIKILTKSINVPGDGNCLFWAVALAYLTPAKNDDNLFQDRFKKLFGQDKVQDLLYAQEVIQNYNPFVSQQNIIGDQILNELVTQRLRHKVVEHMRAKEDDFKQSVEGESGCTFEQYLNKMDVSGAWGGEPEIKAMSQMLNCVIKVHSAIPYPPYGIGTDRIELYHEGLISDVSTSSVSGLNRNHYNFGVDTNIVDDYQRLRIIQSYDYSSSKNKKKLTMGGDIPPGKESIVEVDTESSQSPANSNDSDVVPKFERQNTFANESNKYSSSVGLKSSLHGTIYQLKLLILFLQRGLDKGYSFRLATEMDEAEKFDDLVFQYAKKNDRGVIEKDDQGNAVYAYRVLQAKHKQDENKKITYDDLCTDNKKGEFSLPKYFTSYRKIKQKSESGKDGFSKGRVEDYILCTNINFDFDQLKKVGIETKLIEGHDNFLKFEDVKKVPVRYKLIVNDQHELYEKLRETSDLYRLAQELKERILKDQCITLRSDIFKLYHVALKTTVFEIIEEKEKNAKGKEVTKKYVKFCNSFLQADDKNRSEEVSNFRKILKSTLKIDNDNDFQQKMMSINIKGLAASLTFGKELVPPLEKNPNIADPRELAEKIAQSISKAENNIVTNSNESIEIDVIKDIDHLAGHVLVQVEEEGNNLVRFRSEFFNDNTKLDGNLETFKTALKKELKDQDIDFSDLNQYKFKINNFITCKEKEYYKSTLPNDKIENPEIKEFLDKLVFAVNQPNEDELGNIIKGEIGEKCNLIDSDFIADHIQRKMLDWFKAKGEKGEEGIFFTNRDANKLFTSTKQQIAKGVLVSSKLEYSAKIEELGIEFEENIINELPLHDFLTSKNKKQIFNLNTEYNTLSSIKIYQVLQKMPEYKKDDSYIFIHFNSLLRMQDHVIQAFKSKTSNLLVIECSEDKSIKEEYIKRIHNKLSKTINSEANINKKIVLIAKQGEALSNLLKNDPKLDNKYQEITDTKHSFSDLTIESQRKLLNESKILLQGYEVNLNELINENNEELKNLIDSETLVKLINKDEITIGEHLRSSDIIKDCIEDYYIDRTFNYNIEINDKVFKDLKISSLIAISNTDKAALKKFLPVDSEISMFQENDSDSNSRFIILDNHLDKAENQFQQLCNHHPHTTIHWLKSESDKLIWQRSQGGISELHKYIKIDETHTQNYSETDLLNQNAKHKMMIISDTAGMGKSTVLTHLSQTIKKTQPYLWVVKLDLNSYTTQLERELNKPSFNHHNSYETVNFISKDLLKLNKPFVQKLFKHSIKQPNRVVLLFDGFDEISPNYKNIVVNLLQVLRNTGVDKLWVTTRPHMQNTLEDKLGVLAYNLKPISIGEQIKLLTKFWQNETSVESITNTKKIEVYAKVLIEQMTNSINDKKKEFTSIPLQTKMLAEVFKDDFEKFYQSNETAPKLPKQLRNLTALYDLFVQKKNDIYHKEKNKKDTSILGVKKDIEKLQQDFLKIHQNVAVYTLFKKEEREILLSKQDIKEINNFVNKIQEERTGIIVPNINNQPHFIHKTFAEYFAANFLANQLLENWKDQKVQEFLLTNILIKLDYQVIRAFLNDQLARETLLEEDTLVQYGNRINELWQTNEQNLYHKNNQTILHIAVIEGNKKIVRFLLNSLENHSETLDYLVNAKDVNGRTALHYASKQGEVEVVEWMVNTQKIKIEDTDNYGKTVLHAALYGKFEVVEWLVDKTKANVNAADNSGKTVLHLAIEKRELKEVQWLVEKGANIKITGEYKTALHYAAINGKFEIIKWLVEKGADINATNSNQTVLLSACEYGNLDIIKWLIEKGADVDITDSGYHTIHRAYHHAMHTRNYELIPQIIKLLVSYGTDPNVQDKRGDTLAHYAAERNDVKTLEVLHSKNADFTITNWNNNTALDKCTEDCKQNKEAYKFLLQFSQQPIEEKIALAIQFEDLNNLKEYLSILSKKSDKKKEELLNTETKYGLIGSIACGIGNLEIIELLEKNGCNLGLIAKDEYTALEKACDANNVELFHSEDRVKLITYLIDDKKIEITGYALHNTLHCSSSEILTLLLDKGVDPDLKYIPNLTPLLYLINLPGVNEEKIEKIKLLLERGANIFMHDGYIGNSLHLAAEMGHIQVINLLLIYAKEKDKLEQLLQLSPEECRTCKGMNAYEIAFKYKRAEAVEILKEYFPNTNLTSMQVIDNSASKCDNTEMEDELDDKRQSNEQRKECLTPQIIDNSSSISDHKINLPQIDINQLNERRKEWLKKFDQPIGDWDLENKIALMGNSDISTDSD